MFPYDARTGCYLRATGRAAIADLADANAENLRPDPEVDAQRGRIFDRLIEIDLSELEPGWVGPHTPDLRHTAAEIGAFADREGYPKGHQECAHRLLHQLLL